MEEIRLDRGAQSGQRNFRLQGRLSFRGPPGPPLKKGLSLQLVLFPGVAAAVSFSTTWWHCSLEFKMHLHLKMKLPSAV